MGMEKKMRKILLYFILFIFCVGCSRNTMESPAQTISPTENHITDPKETPVILPDNKFDYCYSYLSITEQQKKDILTYFNMVPSVVLIDKNYSKVGWIFEGGTYVGDNFDDPEATFYFEYNSTISATLYFGKLNKIADNIYSADGTFASHYSENEDLIDEGIDFYVVFSKDKSKIKIILKKSSLDELVNIEFDSYYQLDN